MTLNGQQYMHYDAGGARGPYTARHAEGPWYAMAPEGVDIPAGSPVLQSGGFAGLRDLMQTHGELFHRVGWASEKSLRAGLQPGLRGEVGWVPLRRS